MKKYLSILLLVMMLAMAACSSSPSANDSGEPETTGSTTQQEPEQTPEEPELPEVPEEPVSSELTLGSTFVFDEIEITFGESYTFDTVKNQYSEYNGSDVICLPVTVTNVSAETHHLNSFYYTVFGSKGTSLGSVGAYFDNALDWSGDMRSGATQELVAYLLYDGDGDYYFEFEKAWGDKLEVRIPITKPE